MQKFTHKTLGCAFALGLASCTLASGISDYEVNPELVQRDLNLTLEGMGAHIEQELNVAVVEAQDNTLQARALVLMRPGKISAYPAENIVLKRGLGMGAYKLFFFVDSDSEIPESEKPGHCGLIRGEQFCRDGEVEPREHQWIKTVNPDGTYDFIHSTTFQFFTTKDYDSPGSDLVLPLSGASLTALNAVLLQHNLEIRITLISEERQVGLFRAYKRTQLFGDLRIAGIIDNGNDYRIESVVDGVVSKSVDVTAPQQGDLELKPTQLSFVRKN